MKSLIVFIISLSLLFFDGAVAASQPDYDAEVLRVTGCEEIRSTASSCRVTVRVKNTGARGWDSGNFRLDGRIVQMPSGASGGQREELAHNNTKVSLEAGKYDDFTYEIEGTPYLGQYELEWCMAHTLGSGFTRFGDCQRRAITVVR